MRYAVLAVDFDGVLARDGRVDNETIAALSLLRASGRKLVLVTGRVLRELLELFPQTALFDRVVAENGGTLYTPATREERLLAAPPSPALIRYLQTRGVSPLSVGRVVIASWHPHETEIIAAIQELGLEHQIIFNKGAVMALPPSINKSTGLSIALEELRLSPHNLVAIGDAENDHAMLDLAECAVAVTNATPLLKERADLLTAGDHGAGVVDIINALIADDLAIAQASLRRHDISIGFGTDGVAIKLPPYGVNILVAGPSGSGKSTFLADLLERLSLVGYQTCVIDPEGDYESLPFPLVVGGIEGPPAIDDIVQILGHSDRSVIANLVGVPLAARPTYFSVLLREIAKLRANSGRPHWLALDEAHHLLPGWGLAGLPSVNAELKESIIVTINPAHIATDALNQVDVVIAIGKGSHATMGAFCRAVGESLPECPSIDTDPGDAIVWFRRNGQRAVRIYLNPPKVHPRRHQRKHAQETIDSWNSFYFRPLDGHPRLQAANLTQFAELAGRVDDETWLYHLHRGDFARWFRDVVKDEDLAAEADRGAILAQAAVAESRALILQAIARWYTPAE